MASSEYLNRDSLRSSIRRYFGLTNDSYKIPAAEGGVSDLMISLHQKFSLPLDQNELFAWHLMLTVTRLDLHSMGSYRTHEDPIQVVSGYAHRLKGSSGK